MNQFVDKIKHYWIWFRRFRYRRGYGVHSPFAFNLIHDVIYEQGCFYAYNALEETFGGNSKYLRLLFRLTNFVHPQAILSLNASEAVLGYMREACPSAHFLGMQSGEAADAIVAFAGQGEGQEVWISELLAKGMKTKSLLIVEGIYASKVSLQRWADLQQDERVGVTFDLYDIGLVFFDLDRFKQHYIVNF